MAQHVLIRPGDGAATAGTYWLALVTFGERTTPQTQRSDTAAQLYPLQVDTLDLDPVHPKRLFVFGSPDVHGLDVGNVRPFFSDAQTLKGIN